MKKILISLIPLWVQAEELEPMIVTETAYPIALHQSLGSVEIIEREQIESMSGSDVADILKFYLGLEIARNGGPGQVTSLFIRGTESDQNLILINGVPINSGSVGSAALAHIDPQLIERIEVYKGARATLWGSSAIGGVINIITRQPIEKQIDYGLSLELGEQKTSKASARWAYQKQKFHAQIGLSWHETGGFPSLSRSDLDRAYRNLSFDGQLTYGDFSISHWQAQGNVEYLDYFAQPLEQDFLNSRSSIDWRTELNSVWSSHFAWNFVRDHLEDVDATFKTDRQELYWQNQFDLDAIWLLGFKYTWETVNAQGGWSPYDSQTEFYEIWGQWDRYFGAHHILAGLRYIDHQDAGDHWVGSFNYGYSLNRSLDIRASAASAFRLPSANERFGFGGNPDLKPEVSFNYELGVNYYTGPWSLKATAYQNRIKNMIQWVMTDPINFIGQNQNIARVEITGLELSSQFDWQNGSVYLGANWQDPRDKTTDQKLLRRASQNLNARFQYRIQKWQFNLDALYAGQRKDFGGIDLDAYTLVNFNLNYRLNADWKIYGRLDNLFDEDYELAHGYNTAGRTAFIGLRYR